MGRKKRGEGATTGERDRISNTRRMRKGLVRLSGIQFGSNFASKINRREG